LEALGLAVCLRNPAGRGNPVYLARFQVAGDLLKLKGNAMSQAAEALKAQLRDRVGKGAARELRRNAMVPAVIYGDKQDPLAIALPYKELAMRVHGGGFMTTLAKIEIDGNEHLVLPRDFQLDPVRDFIEHVDFLRVNENSRVVVMIPVHFRNEGLSPGLVRGGVLNIVRHEIEVDCRVTAIPEYFEVDLTGLDIGDSVHISAVSLPENVKLTITDRDFTVITIAGSSAVIEEAQDEAAVLAGEEEGGAEDEGAEEAEGKDEE
jgi:large subunit ribosomal protein L25